MARSVLLNNGARIPAVGLGVWESGGDTRPAVRSALQIGYRHIDTAQTYQNEADVGLAVEEFLKKGEVTRKDIWITTKVWLTNWGYEKATESLHESLKKLRTDYVDLVLLHAPGEPATRAETWRALEDAQKQGLARSIGVSNFGIDHLEKLLQTATVVPVVNQIELTPFLQRREVVKYCQDKGIVIEAYSPLARGNKLQDPRLQAVAARHNVTTAQVLVRWSLQHGFVPLPKSVNADRQRINFDVESFELTEVDVAELDALEEGAVYCWDPIKDAAV